MVILSRFVSRQPGGANDSRLFSPIETGGNQTGDQPLVSGVERQGGRATFSAPAIGAERSI
jgi:hypothetical protein